MHKRYSDVNAIYDLDTDLFIDVILNVIEKDIEQTIWEKWLAFSPHMETQKSFTDYKKEHLGNGNNNNNNLTDEEIIKDAENILKGDFEL